jgi:hypothetical protein
MFMNIGGLTDQNVFTLVNASMTPEQKAAKVEKGRINAMKRWSSAT